MTGDNFALAERYENTLLNAINAMEKTFAFLPKVDYASNLLYSMNGFLANMIPLLETNPIYTESYISKLSNIKNF